MKTSATMRLLIVDDQPVLTDAVTCILRQYGYDCTPAYDGDQAVTLARQLRPQFILMGRAMAGTEAARIILDEMPDCNIIHFRAKRTN